MSRDYCWINGTIEQDINVCRALEKLPQDQQGVVKAKSDGEFTISHANAADLFLNDKGPGRSTYSAFLKKFPTYTITKNAFSRLARFFDSKRYPERCNTKRDNRFSPFVHVSHCDDPASFIAKVKEESKRYTVMRYFTAEWCGPCKTLKPQMERFARRYPDVKIYAFDMTNLKGPELHKINEQMDIHHIPYAQIIQNGEITLKETCDSYFLNEGVKKAGLQPRRSTDIVERVTGMSSDEVIFDDNIIDGEKLPDDIDPRDYVSVIGELIYLSDDHPLAGIAKDILGETDVTISEIEDSAVLDSTLEELKLKVHDLPFYLASFRSARAFYHLADEAPIDTSSRSLNVLVPASGSHVAPLVTAMRLMDQNRIDEAKFIYTEINPRTVDNLVSVLRKWSSFNPNLSEPEIVEYRRGDNGGDITAIRVYWHNRPITIEVKIKDSPKGGYFDPEDASNANIIVLHDVGTYAKGNVEPCKKIVPEIFESVRNRAEHDPALIVTDNFWGDDILLLGEGGRIEANYGHATPFEIENDQVRKNLNGHEAWRQARNGVWLLGNSTLFNKLKSKEDIELALIPSNPKGKKVVSVRDVDKRWALCLNLLKRLDASSGGTITTQMIDTLIYANQHPALKKWAVKRLREIEAGILPAELSKELVATTYPDVWVNTSERFIKLRKLYWQTKGAKKLVWEKLKKMEWQSNVESSEAIHIYYRIREQHSK